VLTLAVSVGVASAAGSIAADDVPAAEPGARAAAPQARPVDPKLLRHVRAAFAGLNGDSAAAREQARQILMQLRRADLDALRVVVRERLPLAPEEAEGLRDIVTHVFLSSDSYDMDASKGFLGVMSDEEQIQGFGEPQCGGVEIRRRLPGFCAYRCFEDGDVVLSVGNPPAVAELHSFTEMTLAVKSFSAGETVMFTLLRRGRVVRVPVVLDALPKDLQPAMVPDFLANRNAEAVDYWEKNFEPLVGD
jgi:hypothetical protein